MVLAHHSLLVIPAFSATFYGGAGSESAVISWFTNSPLRILWAGTEAVYLFFILSGIVLSIAARSIKFSWSSYFPSRLVRLYVPVAAAVLLAAGTISLVPRDGMSESAWIAARPSSFTAHALIADMTLLDGVSRTVSPLWSLQWEVIFSLSLPVYLYLARVFKARTQISCSILLSTLGVAIDLPLLTYLPMFAIGVALGTNWETVATLGVRISELRFSNALWAGIAVVAVCLTTTRWTLGTILSPDAAELLSTPMSLLGVTIVLCVSVGWRPVTSILQSAPFRLLGLLSFSLYLIHEPIVIATSYLFDDPKLSIPIGFGVSLLAAYGFFHLIERPTQKLSRRIRDAETVRMTEMT